MTKLYEGKTPTDWINLLDIIGEDTTGTIELFNAGREGGVDILYTESIEPPTIKTYYKLIKRQKRAVLTISPQPIWIKSEMQSAKLIISRPNDNLTAIFKSDASGNLKMADGTAGISFDLIGRGSTSTTEAIISDSQGGANTEQPLTGALSALKISSDSTLDIDTTGTGAQTILVEGLDVNYFQISEVVKLNGQTGVPLINSYLFISKLSTLTAGSGLRNAGNIYIGNGTITSGVPAVRYITMALTTNVSRLGMYVVPAKHDLVIKSIQPNASASIMMTYRFYIKLFGQLYQQRLTLDLFNACPNLATVFTLPEKTAFKVTCAAASGTPTATVISNAYLVTK